MRQTTVLISGADGYIALHIARMLINNNYQVRTATRDSSGDLRMDFSNPAEVASLRSSGIDVMIHTVSPNEALYKTDPYRALSENVTGIHAALDFCVNNNVKNFIYFSSFHVFGMSKGRLAENTIVTPHNDYGLAHSVAEHTVQMYDRAKRVNGWIVRPSNLFGVPVDCEKFKRWNLIPFLFCKEAVERNKITLLTPGSQLRNFVGANDVARTVKWILENRPIERVIHSYGNETISVLDYALLVQRVAKESFQLPVQIIRPDGDDLVNDFDFTSLYKNSKLTPSDNLELFVKEMLEVLLSRS
jgi:UDP-glucose 4-epimerase